MIGIKAINTFIPGKSIQFKELREYQDLPENEKEYFTASNYGSFVDAGELGSYELALGASRMLLEEQGLDPEEVDYIIYIQSRTPEHFISSEATRLQAALGLTKALPFAISNLGCADSSMALKLANDLLKSNKKANKILICYGNKLFSDYRLRYPVTLMGDGGVAALVGRTENHIFLDIQIETNGKYWDLFKLEYRDKKSNELKESCSDLRKYGFELAIESKNRFQAINERILNNHGLEWGNIQHIMMQNISERAYSYYEEAFGFRISPICKMNLMKYGHLGSADILLNYKTGFDSGIFQSGQHVLIMNNSPVAAWSSILMEV